ncbi:MAG: FAD-dependent oxidoreductase, partial [Rhodospirillaceae bacterium]|nr:FAD-dependent oxidoreductase [Rhodospirillaceae bacterium]
MKTGSQKFPTDPHGWAELLPAREAAPSLHGRHGAAWAVVGGGMTGLACARRLAALHPDQDILLLEARLVGQGASGRNSGFAVAVSHFNGGFAAGQMPEYRRVNRINRAGLDLLRAQVAEFAISCQWHEGGFHHTAADKMAIRELTHFRQYLEAMEIAHTPLDRTALQGRLGTAYYQHGVHVHQGALLQPAALVRGLADTLPANVKLYEQSPVLGMEGGNRLILRLAKGTVECDKVILATNYEAGKLGLLRRRLTASTLSGSFTRVL